MASAAFKSTTRRTLHASADRDRPSPSTAPCPRRSRSVTPGPRLLGDYARTTRTNPLFDRDGGASPPPIPPSGASRERGREERKGSVSERARSVYAAPTRRRRVVASASPVGDPGGGGAGRVLRARSVPKDEDARPCRGSETDVETRDAAKPASTVQCWRSRHSASGPSQAILQRNHAAIPAEQILEIPPEFDPDSAEFASDISDYAAEFKRRNIVEIPAEPVSDKRHHAAQLHWEPMEIPLDCDPDSAFARDITEYTTKLKQSHDRTRKLRADLAVEEQREQELSRMLKGIVTVPNLTETHKRRPRRKTSIERLRVSRHLAEEAMSYFEECVSISTLDSTDFSSPEDPQPNSVGTVQSKSNNRFLLKGGSNFLEPQFRSDQHSCHEESDNQTQCSMSITGSDVSDIVIFSHEDASGLGTRNSFSDDLDGVDTPRSRTSCFSFTHEPAKPAENCDVGHHLRSFSRRISKERSSYWSDDYASQKVIEDLLTDSVTLKNRTEYGGLLICNVRTF